MYFLYNNEYRTFKPVELTVRKELSRKEKNGGNEPIWDTIHIHMEIQSNSLYSYLKVKFLFFFLKNGGQEHKPGPFWGLVLVGRGGYKEKV
jgi:hypothetical protein